MVCPSQVRQGKVGVVSRRSGLPHKQVAEPGSGWGLSASVQARPYVHAWPYLLAQTLVDPSFLT